MSLRNKAVIVGVGESDIGKTPHMTGLGLNAQAAKRALDDAGLAVSDIDGLLTAYSFTEPYFMLGTVMAEYLGLKPRYCAALITGGASPAAMLHHAAMAVANGTCNTVLVCAGENRVTGLGRDAAVAALAAVGHPYFEAPYGASIPSLYAMVARRYMHEYGLTRRQLASVAVNTRAHAALHPSAQMRKPITIEEVIESKPIADPLTLLDCCLISDAGGAFIVTTPERARGLPRKPVYLWGIGEAHTHEHLVCAESFTRFGAVESGRAAFDMAEVAPADIKLAQLVSLWAMQSTGLEFTEGELAPYRTMMYGGTITSSTDPSLGKLWQGDTTTATEFLAKSPNDLLVRVNAAGAFARSGKMADHADKLVTTPTDFATTPALDYLLRAMVFESTGLSSAAMSERMLALANRPGSELIYKQFLAKLPPAMMGDDFTAQVNPWRFRTPARPIDEMRGARLLQLSCQHFLGNKSFAEADQETIDAIIYYANPSIDSAMRGLKNGGPVPSLVEIAFRSFVYLDRRAEIDPLFASSLEQYPGSARLWKARLRAESSRSKGSADAARGVAKKAIEVAAKHPDVGLMAFEFFSEVHFRAAQEANRQLEPAEVRANPDWALVVTGLELFLNGPEKGERLARVAAILGAAEDWETLTKISATLDAETRAAAVASLNAQGYDGVAQHLATSAAPNADAPADAATEAPADAATPSE